MLLVIGCGCIVHKKKLPNAEVLEEQITLVNNETDKKVDVLIDGNLFTSYLYSDDISVLKKPPSIQLLLQMEKPLPVDILWQPNPMKEQITHTKWMLDLILEM
ncbi:MAG: hypothetical protein ACI9DJ_002432 [Algoriphagus sp.]|jgi:hypothetical protein